MNGVRLNGFKSKKKQMKNRSHNIIIKSHLLLGLLMLAGPRADAALEVAGKDPVGTGATACIERAHRMLSEGNPAGAADQLRLLPELATLPEELAVDAEAIMAEASCRLALPSSAILAEKFLASHPDSRHADAVRFALANLRLDEGDYQGAKRDYEAIKVSALPEEDRNTLLANLIATNFRCGLIKEGKELTGILARRKGMEEKAIFYEAYSDYIGKDYESSYPKFEKVSPEFHPGYYLAQMDYTRKDFDKVLERALPLLSGNPDPELGSDLRRVAGLSYFKKGNTEKAYPLLRDYCGNSGFNPADDAIYALGSIEYSRGNFDEAFSLLEKVAPERNAIGQGARLLMGQISASRGDSSGAAIAFEDAATKSFDSKIEEQALYNLIVARMKGGKVPFADNISLLETYLNSFPESAHSEEVRKNLAAAYFHEKDYPRALESIRRLHHDTPEVRRVRQKILYELGMEEEANNRHEQAAKHLAEAASMTDADANVANEASLWEGNARYALGDFRGAEKAFAKAARTLKGRNRTLALYNRAYALLMNRNFREALREFTGLEKTGVSVLGANVENDVEVRIADCRYYTGDYAGAERDFASLSSRSGETSDYASYRHAVIRGLRGDTEGKIKELKGLVSSRKENRWKPQILLELEQTLTSLDRVKEASEVIALMSDSYPGNRHTRTATLDLAVAQARVGENDRSIESYMKVISSWPGSEEARLADNDLRKLAAASGRLDEYSRFIARIPGFSAPDRQETETLLFEAAESAYADNPADTRRLREYVAEYPEGQYLSIALLDLASYCKSSGKHSQALDYLQTLLAKRASSTEAPEALVMKGEIIEKHFPARKKEALDAYRKLESAGGSDFSAEAWGGIMRTTTSASERLRYARQLQSLGGIDADLLLQSRLYEGLTLIEGKQTREGERILTELSKTPSTEAGARAAVELGEHYLKEGNLKSAKQVLEGFTDAGTPHQYWLARGFIALSDVYRKEGKKSLADDYLRSLQENYPGKESDIINAINSRLK